MPTRSEAEENLRVIRSLMERSTIYRAISAPVALVAGLAAILGCLLGMLENSPFNNDDANSYFFLGVWLVVLAIAAISNLFFLRRDAAKRGEAFISPGMKMALRALAPCHLAAVAFTISLINSVWLLPMVWMILYGLGLLATQQFAPRSITLLGWGFLVAGLGNLIPPAFAYTSILSETIYAANLEMGLTFGVFHLAYAACTWPRKSTEPTPGDEP